MKIPWFSSFIPSARLTSICSYSLSQLLALHTSSFSHLPLVISPPAINAALPLSLSLPPALPVFLGWEGVAPSCYTRSPYFFASLSSLGMLFFSAFTSLSFITSAAVVSLSRPLFDSPLGSLALLLYVLQPFQFLLPLTSSHSPALLHLHLFIPLQIFSDFIYLFFIFFCILHSPFPRIPPAHIPTHSSLPLTALHTSLSLFLCPPHPPPHSQMFCPFSASTLLR